MKTFCLVAVAALIASVAARHRGGHGHDGGGQGGWGQGSRGHGGDGDSDGDGGHHHSWGSQQYSSPTNICPATNRIIIISDYISYTNVALNCIGTCNFQANSALSEIAAQTYDKTDSVVIIIGPYSVPNTATTILSNATLLAALVAKTNVYLTTVPVYPAITDAIIVSDIASTNELVRTAAATPGLHLIDFQAFYKQYVKYNMYNHWNAFQTCIWMRDQLVAAGVVFPAPAPVPAPVVPAVPAASTVAGATLAPF